MMKNIAFGLIKRYNRGESERIIAYKRKGGRIDVKNHRICRLLAFVLVLMLAVPCFAAADEEILDAELTDPAALPEVVADAPTDGAEIEEIIVSAPEEEPAACEAELDLDAIQEAPAEVPEATVAEAQVASEAEAADAEAQTAGEAEAPMADLLSEAVEAVSEAPAEAPAVASAEEPVVADEAGAEQSDKLFAGGPTAVAISASQGNVFYLGMGPSQLTVITEPAGAQTTLKWKSSKKKVVKVDKNGVITPRKAGKAKITVTTGNKKKSSMKVIVRRNLVDGINARPSKAVVRSIGRSWTLAPKSVERTAGGKYVCKFYLLNGLGKSKRINNMGLQLYVGGTLVAQKYIKRLKVSSGKGSTKVIKVTFGGADIVNPTPLLLPQYGAGSIQFKLTTMPSLTYVIRR